MAILKIEIELDSKISGISEDIDGKRKILSQEKMISFITGKLGDLYLNLLIPHDGVMMELHAKKTNMMKKGAIFDVMPIGKGEALIKVKGIFKVEAYSHVAERVKTSNEPIYVTGLYAGDWPPTGGTLADYDSKQQKSTVIGKLT